MNRETFEAWVKREYPGTILQRDRHGYYTNEAPRKMWAAWQAQAALAPAAAVPPTGIPGWRPGWKLVPLEPPRQVLLAMHDGPLCAWGEKMDAETEEWLIEMWKAGVAAAPDHPAVEGRAEGGHG